SSDCGSSGQASSRANRRSCRSMASFAASTWERSSTLTIIKPDSSTDRVISNIKTSARRVLNLFMAVLPSVSDQNLGQKVKPRRLPPRPVALISHDALRLSRKHRIFELFQFGQRIFLHIFMQAVAVGVHRHNGRKAVHVKLPHRFRNSEFHKVD